MMPELNFQPLANTLLGRTMPAWHLEFSESESTEEELGGWGLGVSPDDPEKSLERWHAIIWEDIRLQSPIFYDMVVDFNDRQMSPLYDDLVHKIDDDIEETGGPEPHTSKDDDAFEMEW